MERQSLGIEALSLDDASGNKSALFAPKDSYYDLNECYALSKYDKFKALKSIDGYYPFSVTL